MANRIESEPKAPRKRQPGSRRGKASTPGKTAVPVTAATVTAARAAGGTATATPAAQPTTITVKERYRLIAEAAYFIAEQRGFAEGRELENWLEAEAIVNARLKGKVV
jgi:hypothetical protein